MLTEGCWSPLPKSELNGKLQGFREGPQCCPQDAWASGIGAHVSEGQPPSRGGCAVKPKYTQNFAGPVWRKGI